LGEITRDPDLVRLREGSVIRHLRIRVDVDRDATEREIQRPVAHGIDDERSLRRFEFELGHRRSLRRGARPGESYHQDRQ